jgi:hypothetical protein
VTGKVNVPLGENRLHGKKKKRKPAGPIQERTRIWPIAI